MATLRCYTCHRDLPEEAFYPSSSTKRGRQGRCKECDRRKRIEKEALRKERVRAMITLELENDH